MRRRRLASAVVAVLGLLLVTGGVLAALSTSPTHRAGGAIRTMGPPAEATRSEPPTPAGWQVVAPTTTIPADTPVQQHYDQGFAQGFASAVNRASLAAVEVLHTPAPAVGGGWPALATSASPERWTAAFVTALLTVDFAIQHRSALGAWLVAESGVDLMPGIPPSAGDHMLYASVLEPADLPGDRSPIPSAAQWRANAAAGVRWSVRGIQVTPDPSYEQMVTAGWQPADLYEAVEDVTGQLVVTQGTSTTTRALSLVVQLGSARYHHDFGTTLVGAPS